MGSDMTTRINSVAWRAVQPGQQMIEGEQHDIVIVECGDLMLPSGRLVAEDPFVTLTTDNPYNLVTPGTYPVRATVDETIGRVMYLSLCLSPAPEVVRRVLIPHRPDGSAYPTPVHDSYYGIAVDAGTVCFVDDEAVKRGMPTDESSWLSEVFDNDSEKCWFKMMDAADHPTAAIANIPLTSDGANIVICHSGWGDGFYPVIGGYNADGALVAAHIDLLIFDE